MPLWSAASTARLAKVSASAVSITEVRTAIPSSRKSAMTRASSVDPRYKIGDTISCLLPMNRNGDHDSLPGEIRRQCPHFGPFQPGPSPGIVHDFAAVLFRHLCFLLTHEAPQLGTESQSIRAIGQLAATVSWIIP